MKIGLYFGSFNPIHIGHLALANYMVEYTDLEALWFVVSPQNPFKKKSSLLADYHRYELVFRAIDDFPKFRVSNIEFNMPKPSYTIDTLAYLYDKYPKHQFALIMGEDNLPTFHKWKNPKEILATTTLYVYPRYGYDGGELKNHERVKIVDAPKIELSSSFIRKAIKDGKNLKFFVPAKAYEYIEEMNFYSK